MQIEDLQKQWQQLDDKLDRSLRINTEVLRQTVVGSTRGRLTRWMMWPSIDIVAGMFVAIFTIAFATDHWAAWELMLPVLVLLAGAISLCISSVRQIGMISEMDWAGPVVSLQQTLASLRVVQIKQIYWILLTSPIVGFCGLMVFLQWLLDFSPEPQIIIEKLNGNWLWGNLVFGILFVALGYLATRLFSRRFCNRSWWKRLEDSLAGTTVLRARDELDQWMRLNDDEHVMGGKR